MCNTTTCFFAYLVAAKTQPAKVLCRLSQQCIKLAAIELKPQKVRLIVLQKIGFLSHTSKAQPMHECMLCGCKTNSAIQHDAIPKCNDWIGDENMQW